MEVKPFLFSRIPRIHFGTNTADELGKIVSSFGNRALWVRGKGSLSRSGAFAAIADSLKRASVEFFEWEISGEPSPEGIDKAVAAHAGRGIKVVLSVGGGSVIDAGKAISAMLPLCEPVTDYLEDVGAKTHPGTKIPFIAVPTTAGTGTEATKNAVISSVGPNGFKKSLRHDNFMPDVAVVDPLLSRSCPPDITATCGMDALSQLLESFVSTKASALTDTLALSGMERVRDSLVPACTTAAQDVSIRANMAYAALVSGITLANAGLCVIHGFASSVGGLHTIPHGAVCGALLAPSMRRTLSKLSGSEAGHVHIVKLARAGEALCGRRAGTVMETGAMLIDKLEEFTRVLKIPKLGRFGITASSIEAIVDRTDNKNNPVKLDKEDLKRILIESL